MLGIIWFLLILTAVIIGGYTGKIDKVSQAAIESAKFAVEISFSLIGIMALWLGIMNLAEKSGLIALISKKIRPLTRLLFPEIPANHPSIGNIAMSFSANAFGLTNAATPIGIKAMKEMQSLNKDKKTATNSMCMFLAINTAGFQLIPVSVIAILSAAGDKNPAIIIGPTLIATCIALLSAIAAAKIFEKLSFFKS